MANETQTAERIQRTIGSALASDTIKLIREMALGRTVRDCTIPILKRNRQAVDSLSDIGKKAYQNWIEWEPILDPEVMHIASLNYG